MHSDSLQKFFCNRTSIIASSLLGVQFTYPVGTEPPSGLFPSNALPTFVFQTLPVSY